MTPSPDPARRAPEVDEAIAKAWWFAHFGYHCVGVPYYTWEERGESIQRNYREDADRFQASITAQGLVVVRREELDQLWLEADAIVTGIDQESYLTRKHLRDQAVRLVCRIAALTAAPDEPR